MAEKTVDKPKKASRPRRIRSASFRRNCFIFLMLAWPVLHWLIFTGYMNIQTVLYSFQRWNPYTGVQEYVGFSNYINFIRDFAAGRNLFREAIGNSLLWIPFNNLVLLPVSIVVAYFLSKKIPLHNFFRTVFFFPNMISIVILTMVWQFMWAPTQGIVNGILEGIGLKSLAHMWLGDHHTALLNILFYCLWAGIGYNCVVLGGAIGRISPELYESAAIDGITPWREFWNIVIPSIWPTISTLVIIYTSTAFVIFLQPQLLTRGQYGTTTIALRLVQLVTEKNDYGMASAVGIAIAIVGFLVTYTFKFGMDKLDDRWYGSEKEPKKKRARRAKHG